MANSKGMTDKDFAAQVREALGVDSNEEALAAFQAAQDKGADEVSETGEGDTGESGDAGQEQATPRDPNNPTAEETMRAATGKPPQERNIP